MKSLTVYDSNYKRLKRVLGKDFESLKSCKAYRYKAEGFMDLVVEKLSDNEFSLAHYYTQNGDLMRDPEMVVKIYPEYGFCEAMTFQMDNPSIYQQVYKSVEGQVYVHQRIKIELNSFLRTWLRNLLEQGHTLVEG